MGSIGSPDLKVFNDEIYFELIARYIAKGAHVR